MREDWGPLLYIDDTPSESTKRRGSFKETAGKIIIFIIFLLINIIYAKNCDNILEWRKVHNGYLFFVISLLVILICSISLFTLLLFIRIEKLEIYSFKYGLILSVITIIPSLAVFIAKDPGLSMIFILFFVLLHIPLSDFSNIDYISALTLFSFYALILLFLGFYSNPGFIIYFWGLNLIALQTIIIIGLDKSDGYEKGCKIIENIKDQAILAFIACKTNKWSIGYTAIQKITDKEFIELISNEAILERVKDDARKQLKIYDNLHQS